MPARQRSEHEPSVFDYLDYRRYLREWFKWKKERRRGYSYAVFARAAGFSRGVLNNIIAGRRAPGTDTLEGIGKAMGIAKHEIAFLALLVESAHAVTLEERAVSLRKVFDHPDFGLAQALDASKIEVMSTWSAPAISELVRLPGFCADPAWIAERLGGRLSEEEAAHALDICLRSGEVRKNPDGSYSREHVRLGIGMHSQFDMMRLVHLDLLDLAKDAMTTLPQSERYVLAWSSAMSKSNVPAVQERLVNSMREVGDLMDQSDPTAADDGEVYVCSVYFFPVTGTPPVADDEVTDEDET